MSFARMKMYADKASTDSHRPSLLILLDMVYCSFRYGVGYLDYLTFGFARQNSAARSTFMNMNDNLRLVRSLNLQPECELFEDKTAFAREFSDYLHREFIDLRETNADGLRDFCEKNLSVFAKETHNFGGFGVERLCSLEIEDYSLLCCELVEKKMFLIEQAVVQHSEMNRLCPKSVNTVRVVTILKNGEANVMYALVRMGSGKGYVDNISSGGMYAPLSEAGVITAAAFCDKLGEYFTVHPASGTPIVGFKIPMFSEAIALVRAAATRVPRVRYVGWDVAISESGPLIIEGNTIPSYDMCQNYRHLGPDKLGIKPRFISVLGGEFFK